jgi:uncharacterized membrane protein YdjX (TVP38/TMEM64 family)
MTEMTRPRTAISLRRTLPLMLIALGAAVGYLLLGDTLTFEAVSANRESLLGWRDRNLVAAASVYMAVYVAVVAFSLPGAFVMTVTGGFLFGLLPGVPLAVLSATLGATLIFLAARAGLGEALHARIRAQGGQGFFARIEAGLRDNQVSYLLLMRLVPAVPFVIANLAPAFFGVPLRTFFLTTLFGILPGTFITTWIGVGVGEVFDRGETPGAGLILEPHILGPILGLCALAVLPILLKQRRRIRTRS